MVAGKQERQEGHRDKVDLPGHVPTDLLPPAKPYHSVSAAVYQKVTPLMKLFILMIQLLHEAPPLDPTTLGTRPKGLHTTPKAEQSSTNTS